MAGFSSPERTHSLQSANGSVLTGFGYTNGVTPLAKKQETQTLLESEGGNENDVKNML